MLQIDCPFCGRRDESEFSFGGEANLSRPSIESDDAEWADYLFNKENRKGIHVERWSHYYGCGSWFNVARDTVTHEIYSCYRIGDPTPDLGDKERAQWRDRK